MPNLFTRLLSQRPYLIADGAMATNLFAMGLAINHAPELWNTEHPGKVANLARRFIDAGSDIVLTNSFGANIYRLQHCQAQTRVAELNMSAASILKKVVSEYQHDIIIAGSIGPTGETMLPAGKLSYDDAYNAFKQQAQALQLGGVDVFWIETMADINETHAAYEAAISTGLPAIYTMSFDTDGLSRTGTSANALVKLNEQLSIASDACGINCGHSPSATITSLTSIKKALSVSNNPALIAKTNAGIPRSINSELVYDMSAHTMANYATLALDAGAKIIGGCCGTTPEHIAAMKAALSAHVKKTS
ncbi:betaine--homocysteine S-methyltransferase [Gammaproteobacteria bacterium AS21]